MHIPDRDTIAAAVHQRAEVIAQYQGSELHANVMQLLGLISVVYMHDLAEISPEQLAGKQAALRQIQQLKASLAGKTGHSPLI